ncbi:MAG: hypothetical protein ABIS86_12285 [Streptosporangiaceae bacterium]
MIRYFCLGAVLLTAACSSQPSQPTGIQARPMSLQQLAAGTGCQVQPQQGSADLEQGSCKTDQGRYVLLTFTTDETAESWLTEAKPWGGLYLQGPRWVIVGSGPQLTTFQGKIGGTIVEGEDHGSGQTQTQTHKH